MKRVFVFSGPSLFSQGLKSLLHHELKVHTIGQETEVDQAIKQVKALQPDVIILISSDAASHGQLPILRILKECAGVKVIGLNLQDNTLYIYQTEKRIIKQPEDLLEAIEAGSHTKSTVSI